MSPFPTIRQPGDAVVARVASLGATLGSEIRAARRRRRWTVVRLAAEAGVSPSLVYLVERGEPTTIVTYVRLGAALGLRLEAGLEGPRRPFVANAEDPVHASIVELLAARHQAPDRITAVDEPYQHYQFSGRADLAVIDPAGPDLLHHEVKAALPNVGELAGSWNAKRQFLAGSLARRHGRLDGFRSVTHVLTIAWTAECLHVVRLREATVRALGPDAPDAFDRWWNGQRPAAPGVTSTVVLLDPLERPRAPAWVPLDDLAAVRPRHHDYAALLAELRRAGRA